MRVAITGTPGTGKTTATQRLDTALEVIHLNESITEKGLTSDHDAERNSVVADLDAVETWLDGQENILFESHLAHHFDADKIVILRCHPSQLENRLNDRGESSDSIAENADSEALDVVLTEAAEKHGLDKLYEIDTTDRSPDAVAAAIESVIDGTREPSAGTVSFIDYV